MNQRNNYKIAVIVLSAIVLLQAGFITYLLLGRGQVRRARPGMKAKIKIAIVLDDWGYNLNNLAVLEEIKYPLTVSVLPNLPYSEEVSIEAHKRGFEVILHLPMEPQEKYKLEKDTIMVGMSRNEISRIIGDDLLGLSYIRGVSNHMGSRATADCNIMASVFSELKHRGLYFLDSYVSPNSICLVEAKKIGLPHARNNLFLDNRHEPLYIKGQLMQLAKRALLYGQAIGIGHDRRNTLAVLKEVMPQLEKEGYTFVFVSELIR